MTKQLPARPDPQQYANEATALAAAVSAGEPAAMQRVKRFLRGLGKSVDASGRVGDFDSTSARFVVAREHEFEDWSAFLDYINAVNAGNETILQFEAAADAIVTGKASELQALLNGNPHLVRQRSARMHQGTLLHYLSASGVEEFRQRAAQNAPEIAEILLSAGAEVDASSNIGGGTTLNVLVSSENAAGAGVQVPVRPRSF